VLKAIVLALLLLWLPAAGALASTEGLTFKPPAGWLRVPTQYEQNGIAGAWAGPNDGIFGQNITLRLVSESASVDFETDPERIKSQIPGSTVLRQPVALCHGLVGMYVYIARPYHGRTLVAESVTLIENGTLYNATYSRLSSQQPVAAARKALASLCPATPR